MSLSILCCKYQHLHCAVTVYSGRPEAEMLAHSACQTNRSSRRACSRTLSTRLKHAMRQTDRPQPQQPSPMRYAVEAQLHGRPPIQPLQARGDLHQRGARRRGWPGLPRVRKFRHARRGRLGHVCDPRHRHLVGCKRLFFHLSTATERCLEGVSSSADTGDGRSPVALQQLHPL